MKAVVDASVLIRSVIPDEHTDATRQWIALCTELVAPRFLWYEVVSVMRRLEYLKVIDEITVDQSLNQLLSLPISLVGRKPTYGRMIRLARELDLSRTYDMAYLALAIEQGCPLVTLDERLIRNARSRGYHVSHPREYLS